MEKAVKPRAKDIFDHSHFPLSAFLSLSNLFLSYLLLLISHHASLPSPLSCLDLTRTSIFSLFPNVEPLSDLVIPISMDFFAFLISSSFPSFPCLEFCSLAPLSLYISTIAQEFSFSCPSLLVWPRFHIRPTTVDQKRSGRASNRSKWSRLDQNKVFRARACRKESKASCLPRPPRISSGNQKVESQNFGLIEVENLGTVKFSLLRLMKDIKRCVV